MPTQVLISGWPWYACDGRLHWGMQAMRRADLATFEPLGKYWGRDATRVYNCGSEMRDADRNSFRVLNELYAKDCRKAYTMMGPIAEADVATFEAIGPVLHPFNAENGYAKDCRGVYHTTLGGRTCILKGADPLTFIPRGNGYGSDATSVYFERRKVPGVDLQSWQFVRGPHSRSGKNAYVVGRRIRGADGRRLVSLPILELGGLWCRDDTGYYDRDVAVDPRGYLDVFRNCFIFTGKVSNVSLRFDRENYRPPQGPNPWAFADHAWIDVICSRILQRPDLEVAVEPRVGEPFRFGEGFHIPLLSPPTWMDEERIWIMRPRDSMRVGTLTLLVARNWREYSPLGDLDMISELIAAAKSDEVRCGLG